MKCLWVYIERKYFAINTGFAYPSGNELSILRAKVEYDYRFVIRLAQKMKTSVPGCASKMSNLLESSNYRLAFEEPTKQVTDK